MCGIGGFLGGGADLHAGAQALRVLHRMGDAIAHRGPDGDGYWHDPERRIAFVHRRLAVVDLSPSGVQPMHSASGRYVVAFNGEIYNHRRLRERLDGPWRGSSDTEVLLAGFEQWGVEATLQQAVGMFAIALWDRHDGTLTLARDRLGEKPLYYGWQGAPGAAPTLVFASELGALRRHPDVQPAIDRNALRSYLRYNNIGGEASIYEGIRKLPAGCLLVLRADGAAGTHQRFWSAERTALDGACSRFDGPPAAAVDALDALLRDAIADQMVADVPLGAFLSGGVDSSLVAALMQEQSALPVQTYSIGFREAAYDEAGHAAAVARHLGTAHTEMVVTAQDALDIVPRLPTIYAEPFADSSQIATHLLSVLTRRHVTVALSGDGGDELFAGYNRHAFTQRVWPRVARLPVPLRRAAARVLHGASPATWDRVLQAVQAVRPRAGGWQRFGEKVHKAASVLGSRDLDELYLGMTSQWPDPAALVIGGIEPAPVTTARHPQLRALDPVEQLMALDLLGYMCDDVLVKVDRAAMAASLETRAPFLDHRVVEFAWRLPLDLKLRDGQTKWALRQVLYRRVPAALIERPKSGFGVPVGAWLRGPLRDWAESLLDPALLASQGFFHAAPIRRCWDEHQAGRRQWDGPLWTVLMFQAWWQAQQLAAGAPAR